MDMAINQTFPMAAGIAKDAFEALRDLAYSRGKPLGRNFHISVIGLEGEPIQFRAKDAPNGPKRWFEIWRWKDTPDSTT
jgi:hypothetical protein